MKCSRISPTDILAFRAQMLKDGLSESTIQKEIAAIAIGRCRSDAPQFLPRSGHLCARVLSDPTVDFI